MVTEEQPVNRRERQRAVTVAEIKDRAWAQVAEGGILAVSLRAIARQMGMTSSALYRYFAGQEDLIAALVVDGFASLADALEAAEAELAANGASVAERWLHLSGVYRRWALDHPAVYSLIFGTSIVRVKRVGYDADAEDTPAIVEFTRGVAVLFRLMIDGMTSGVISTDRLPPPGPDLDAKLARWGKHLGIPLTPHQLTGCLFAYSLVHGAVSGELFGQLDPMLEPTDDLFAQQMWAVLVVLHCQGLEDLSAG